MTALDWGGSSQNRLDGSGTDPGVAVWFCTVQRCTPKVNDWRGMR